eukprot:SAG11_NODE_390_length_9860_cov_49.246184_5_plen_151_part_00
MLTLIFLGYLACRRDEGPWDGVFIVNHGAGVSEEHPDMEGAFAAAVREIVGAAVTVAACLDMHANISPTIVGALDILTVWRTCPHVDTRERAVTTAGLLHRTMAGEIEPVLWLEKPPMVRAPPPPPPTHARARAAHTHTPNSPYSFFPAC